jgi:hypothetical protein
MGSSCGLRPEHDHTVSIPTGFQEFRRAGRTARRLPSEVAPPVTAHGLVPSQRMGTPLRSFAADAHDRIMVQVLQDLPDTRLWRDVLRQLASSASDGWAGL